MLGGAMRQVGILAAAGSYALRHNMERLTDDHANARLIGQRLAASRCIGLALGRLETNILVFDLLDGAPDAERFVEGCAQRGVLVFAFGPRRVRAVTHLDVTREQCAAAAEIMLGVAEGS